MRASCGTHHAWCCPVWARSVPGSGPCARAGSTRLSPKRRPAAPRSWACASECRCCAKRARKRRACPGSESAPASVVACPFHPELSGAYGAALLERWLAGAKGAPAPALAGSTPGLLPRVVPCLDVLDGRVVKGVQFQHLRDAGDPASQAALYESQGADEIVVLDVAASAEGRATQLETVARVRAAIRIPLTVGGGVRSVDDARCLLAAGA